MEVDPTAEELQQPTTATAVKAVGTPTVTTTTTNSGGTTNVMTGRRFVLKRRLQNGVGAASPNTACTTNGGENSSNGVPLMPQLVSTPSSLNNSSVGSSATLLSNRVSSGSLKIRKIDP